MPSSKALRAPWKERLRRDERRGNLPVDQVCRRFFLSGDWRTFCHLRKAGSHWVWARDPVTSDFQERFMS